MKEKREGKQKAPQDDSESLPIEEWSKSEASDAEVSDHDAVRATTAEPAEDPDSHSESYVTFHPCNFEHRFRFSSFQDKNIGESLSVMLKSCQDPQLAPTYANLPKLPWVSLSSGSCFKL